NIESILLKINGVQVSHTYDSAAGKISYIPDAKLTEGIHKAELTVVDIAGNRALSEWSFTVDTIPPQIIISGVQNNYYYNGDIKPVINITDLTFIKEDITLDGQPFESNTTISEEGEHIIAVNAVDSAGNESNLKINFTIDKTAPEIIITYPLNNAVFIDKEITLEGSVDGVDFSEKRDLSKIGANIITKTAVDLAGNSSSKFITVYYYPGNIVDSQGGKVTSQEQDIEVVIPQNTLEQSTVIYIDSVDKEILEDAAPVNKDILAAAECSPAGTVFSKAIQIGFELPQAETPGTLLELGLYDKETQQIIPTGQTSIVGRDGITVSFSITHFSIYAVLKGLVSQGAPIGPGVEIPLPDMLTGAFSHSVLLTVPPGRGGMQPGLALTYRSSNPNTWIGVGCSMNTGYIVRSTRLGPPTYNDEQDTFYFITDAGTVELAHVSDDLYKARIETDFTKFYKQADDTWRVLSKDGNVLLFGQTEESREQGNGGIYSWQVTKALDTNKNYIIYEYTKDEGKSYLSRIEYTGNENTNFLPKHSVDFILEPRDDISSNYTSGQKIKTTKRLKEIQVKIKDNLVWRYVLEYIYSTVSERSLLKVVTQYAEDGKHFPAQTFDYKE
ncbi:SpvB/TcaC N-terminal domain-containing protein, partial [bacterium]